MWKIITRKFIFTSVVVFLCMPLFLAAADDVVNDPDPSRFENEINSFKYWDTKNAFPERPILFVGSSSIRMWKTHDAFPDYPVINRGFGGAHISDVQYYYNDVIKKYSPSLIVFYAGDNDIAAGKSSGQVLNDYRHLIERISDDFPDVELIYIPIKPSSSRWEFWTEMEKTNNIIRDFNRENEKLFYVDTVSALLQSDGEPNDNLFLEDKLHLNEKGYKRWNKILAPCLEKLY